MMAQFQRNLTTNLFIKKRFIDQLNESRSHQYMYRLKKNHKNKADPNIVSCHPHTYFVKWYQKNHRNKADPNIVSCYPPHTYLSNGIYRGHFTSIV